MTDTTTRTAETAFGAVDYETVECASCGTEVRKDDGQKFVIGDLKEHRPRFDYEQFRFRNGTWTTGWACPHCQAEGPIGFPERARQWLPEVDPAVAFIVIVWVLAALLIIWIEVGV